MKKNKTANPDRLQGILDGVSPSDLPGALVVEKDSDEARLALIGKVYDADSQVRTVALKAFGALGLHVGKEFGHVSGAKLAKECYRHGSTRGEVIGFQSAIASALAWRVKQNVPEGGWSIAIRLRDVLTTDEFDEFIERATALSGGFTADAINDNKGNFKGYEVVLNRTGSPVHDRQLPVNFETFRMALDAIRKVKTAIAKLAGDAPTAAQARALIEEYRATIATPVPEAEGASAD